MVHGDSEWRHDEDHDEGVEPGDDVDLDSDQPSEGDGGGHDGPAAGAVRQDTEINKGGWSHKAQFVGGVVVPSKRGRWVLVMASMVHLRGRGLTPLQPRGGTFCFYGP